MGQYYIPYIERNGRGKKFSNKVDGEWTGLKLMEHSYNHNCYVGQVVNDLFYNKGRVCWVGDYYYEDDYDQVNCSDKALVKLIGELVWNEDSKLKEIKSTKKHVRFLDGCYLVNHTKHEFIDFDDYFKKNQIEEEWEGEIFHYCIHPLPLLTCTASHSGGCYEGINKDLCGIWFNDELEVVLYDTAHELEEQGYMKRDFEFRE